jgi:HAD superfamily hydrolase (TIGR01509 family)
MPVVPAFPVYLFDIDGTLLDSAADICGAILDVLAETPCRSLDHTGLRRYVGVHLLDMFRELLPDYTEEQYEHLIQNYRVIYPARQHRQTRVYPGVQEALAALGGRKSTATTKNTFNARAILEHFGLIHYFDHVQGTDGFPYKPAPDVIQAALTALNARPEDCLLVGDAPADMQAGRRAGVKICAVRYGYGSLEDLARWAPDYWIDDLRELVG